MGSSLVDGHRVNQSPPKISWSASKAGCTSLLEARKSSTIRLTSQYDKHPEKIPRAVSMPRATQVPPSHRLLQLPSIVVRPHLSRKETPKTEACLRSGRADFAICFRSVAPSAYQQHKTKTIDPPRSPIARGFPKARQETSLLHVPTTEYSSPKICAFKAPVPATPSNLTARG